MLGALVASTQSFQGFEASQGSQGFSASFSGACPPTNSFLGTACGMRIAAMAAASCDNVQAEMQARVDGQFNTWHDPHNNGTYTKQSYGGDFSASRLTGDRMFTDKMIFTFAAVGSNCRIDACSRSQVTSVFDGGTNYCNLKMCAAPLAALLLPPRHAHYHRHPSWTHSCISTAHPCTGSTAVWPRAASLCSMISRLPARPPRSSRAAAST